MNVKISNCSLCSKNDSLFKFDFISKQIENSFFSVNAHLFPKDFVKDLEICTICAYKIQLSTQIKNQYDEMCNRNNKLSHFKCFFCGHKGLGLVNLNKNPNKCQDKIPVFMSSVVTQHNFEDLRSCLQCLYNLDVWFEIRSNLYKMMNIPFTSPSVSDAANNNTKRLRNKSGLLSTSGNAQKTQPNSTNSKESKRRTRGVLKSAHIDNKKQMWCKYLNKKLKNLRTVNELIEKENLIVSNIERDEDKLFNRLPFIEIFVNSQISKEILQKGPNITTIVLSDSDNGTVQKKGDIKKRKLNLSLKKTDSPRNLKPKPNKARSGSKRKTFRFKVPFGSKTSSRESSLSKSLDNSSVSSESLVEISSEDEPNNFNCKICDKNFDAKCDYLVHRLKHDKWENLIVNVLRQDLPKQIDTTELSPKKEQKKTFSSPEIINRLLCKWIGENAAKTYQQINGEKENEEKEKERDEEEESEQTEARAESTSVEELKEPIKDKETDAKEEENEDEADNNEDAPHEEEIVLKNDEEEMDLDTNTSTQSEKDGDQTELIVEEELDEERSSKSEQNEKNKNPPEIERGDQTELIVEEELDEQIEKDKNPPETEGGDENHSENKKEDDDHSQKEEEENTTCILKTDATEEEPSEKEGKEDNQSEEEENLKLSQNKLDDENNEETVDDNEKVGEDVANEASQQEDKNDDVPISSITDEEEPQNKNDDVIISSTTDEEKPQDKNDDVTIFSTTDEEKPQDENDDDTKSGKTDQCSDPDKEKANGGSEVIDALEKVKESVYCADNSNSSDFATPPIMTCEDLLSILETTIDDDEIEPGKRKRVSSDSEVTPKRKKVRFAEEKEIFTPDNSGVLLEKIVESDQFVPDREDEREKESTAEA